MNLTDPDVIKLLKKVKSYRLEQRIEDYPEKERSEYSDMYMFKRELSYLIDCFNDSDSSLYEELLHAKRVLKETRYGKVFLIDTYTLRPKYRPYDAMIAKDIINEYNRLKRLLIRINNMEVSQIAEY